MFQPHMSGESEMNRVRLVIVSTVTQSQSVLLRTGAGTITLNHLKSSSDNECMDVIAFQKDEGRHGDEANHMTHGFYRVLERRRNQL